MCNLMRNIGLLHLHSCIHIRQGECLQYDPLVEHIRRKRGVLLVQDCDAQQLSELVGYDEKHELRELMVCNVDDYGYVHYEWMCDELYHSWGVEHE